MIRLIAALALSLTLTLPAGAASSTDTGPRPGKYRIMSYGAPPNPPLFLGSFVLSPGKYAAFLPGDKPSGEGRYAYDPATHTVTWSSGPYAGVWGGEFTIERGGKTHQIRLKRSTVAVNSTDSP